MSSERPHSDVTSAGGNYIYCLVYKLQNDMLMYVLYIFQ